jgi:hypothetical protein
MVYIDDMYNSPIGKFGRMKMSHMMADTTEELLEIADKIGLARKWIQYPGTNREHFDVCMSKRKKAIQFGAKEITWRELGEMVLNRFEVENKQK